MAVYGGMIHLSLLKHSLPDVGISRDGNQLSLSTELPLRQNTQASWVAKTS